jgi:hypothetical protein
MQDYISINEVFSQMILQELGTACSTTLGNELYFLNKAVRLMISVIGDDSISKEYNKINKIWIRSEEEKKKNRREKSIKEKLDELNENLSYLKIWYDSIQDKRTLGIASPNIINKEKSFSQVQLEIRRFYRKNLKKINLYQNDLFECFVMLTKMSSINNRTIRSDYFKTLEHIGHTAINTSKRQSMPMSNSIQT